MSPDPCAHISAINHRHPGETARVRRMHEDRVSMGSSSYLPGVRRHAVLRQLAESPRDEACTGEPAPGDRVSRVRRAFAILSHCV